MPGYNPDYGLPGYQFVVKTADTTFASATPANVPVGAAGTPVMSLPVKAGRRYKAKVVGVAQSADITVGIRVGFTVPGVTSYSMLVQIIRAGTGAGGTFEGHTDAGAADVAGDAVDVINNDFPFMADGIIVPSADGAITFQFATETGVTNVVCRQGTVLELTDLGG